MNPRELTPSQAFDAALYARLTVLEQDSRLRGLLDIIEAREDLDRRLTTLVDAVTTFFNLPHQHEL